MKINANSQLSLTMDQLTTEKELTNGVDVEKIKKDSARGWTIVLASFIMQFVGDGICFTFGLFYAEIAKEFPEVGKSGASWVASILLASFHVVGPIGSILVNRFGPRTVSFIGSSLASVGFASSYFVTNVPTMYFTIGLLGGSGFGLLYLPAMVTVAQYFDRKLAFAMGICVSGSGSGTLFFEWVIKQMLAEFPWRTTLLLVGGIIAVSLPLGAIYPSTTPTTDKTKRILDWSLLKNAVFLLLAASELFIAVGFNTPYIYLPEIEQKRSNSSSILLSFIGGANVLSRIILGYFGDKNFVNRRYLCIVALIVAGIGTITCPHLETLRWVQGYCTLYGICMGMYISLRSVVTVDFLGLEKLNDAFGFLLLVEAIGIFIGTPTVGFLYDSFGYYDFGFYFSGASFLCGSILLLFLPMAKRLVDRREVVVADVTKGVDNKAFDNTKM